MSKFICRLIINACEIGNLEALKFHTGKVSINEVYTEDGPEEFQNRSPLHVASSKGHFELVKFLVEEKGADVNILQTRPKNNAPLHVAKTAEIVNFLIENNAKIEGLYYHQSPLQKACNNGTLEQVKALVAHNANVNAVNANGGNLLHCASGRITADFVDYLLSIGLDHNQPNDHGNTPFMYACSLPNLAMVQYLAYKGVDVNAINLTSGLAPKSQVEQIIEYEVNYFRGRYSRGIENNDLIEISRKIVNFIDNWNRECEFTEEVGLVMNDPNLSHILFQFYCTGEVMGEPGE